MPDNKFAAYLCGGCGLAERLDMGRLAAVAQKEGKMSLVRTHEFLCSEAGVQSIRDDIEREAVTHVAIAACSRRAKTDAFDFPGTAMTRANLREGVVWARPDTDEARETTQEMAEDYVRMACAEAKKSNVPQGAPGPALCRRLLVVGGGISGLTAAIEAAETGYDVVLVEKAAALGGQAAALWKRVPAAEPYETPVDTGMGQLIARVTSSSRITVRLGATIAETSGAPGRFKVSVAKGNGGGTEDFEVGAIVQATGFGSYDLGKLPELGGGIVANVVDQAGFETLARASLAKGVPMTRPSDGAPVRSVAFVQCAGQRDASGKHLPYCSGHCCATSIKQALYLKEADAAIDCVVMYTDLRVPGQAEDFYRAAQRKGVTFTKAAVSAVKAEGAACTVENLTYRQGPDLPVLKPRLPGLALHLLPVRDAAHRHLRRRLPCAARWTGAGGGGRRRRGDEGHPVRREWRAGGRSPARRRHAYPRLLPPALHAVQALHRGVPVRRHRRGRQGHAPAFNPLPLPALRHLHGRLPGAHHQLPGLLGGHGGEMIKAIEVPEEDEEKPRILLMCENDAVPGARHRRPRRIRYEPVGAGHPDALPRVDQHRLDRRRAVGRHRRGHDDRLQVRRRLPVPLRPRLRARQHPPGQRRRDPAAAGPRARALEIGMSPLKGFA
jgi:hypothetical protein